MKYGYSECYEIIAMYTGDVLPLFADGWSRFPVECNARKIIGRLEQTISFYTKSTLDKRELLDRLGRTVEAIKANS